MEDRVASTRAHGGREARLARVGSDPSQAAVQPAVSPSRAGTEGAEPETVDGLRGSGQGVPRCGGIRSREPRLELRPRGMTVADIAPSHHHTTVHHDITPSHHRITHCTSLCTYLHTHLSWWSWCWSDVVFLWELLVEIPHYAPLPPASASVMAWHRCCPPSHLPRRRWF